MSICETLTMVAGNAYMQCRWIIHESCIRGIALIVAATLPILGAEGDNRNCLFLGISAPLLPSYFDGCLKPRPAGIVLRQLYGQEWIQVNEFFSIWITTWMGCEAWTWHDDDVISAERSAVQLVREAGTNYWSSLQLQPTNNLTDGWNSFSVSYNPSWLINFIANSMESESSHNYRMRLPAVWIRQKSPFESHLFVCVERKRILEIHNFCKLWTENFTVKFIYSELWCRTWKTVKEYFKSFGIAKVTKHE